MKILVAINHCDRWGGSESYTYAMIEELLRRKYEVEAFTANRDRRGRVADELRTRLGVETVLEPQSAYDLLLLSHATCVERLRSVKGFKVQTCHGVVPKLEQPTPGVDRYVAISEEVHDHLKRRGFESVIIRNGVDCARFSPKRSIEERPKKLLAIVQGKQAPKFIAQACQLANLEATFRNKSKNNVFKIEDDINDADVVISLGRGAYEAMACGRNVYVFDTRSYIGPLADGLVTCRNVEEMIKFNCNGKRFHRIVTPQAMAKEISTGYRRERGALLREFAVKCLNIRLQVNKYLALYRKVP